MLHSIRSAAGRPVARLWLLATGLTLGLAAGLPQAQAQETIKVGILHSLSGTMAISETTLARRASATCSTRVLPRTSRRSRPSTI